MLFLQKFKMIFIYEPLYTYFAEIKLEARTYFFYRNSISFSLFSCELPQKPQKIGLKTHQKPLKIYLNLLLATLLIVWKTIESLVPFGKNYLIASSTVLFAQNHLVILSDCFVWFFNWHQVLIEINCQATYWYKISINPGWTLLVGCLNCVSVLSFPCLNTHLISRRNAIISFTLKKEQLWVFDKARIPSFSILNQICF